MKSRHRIGCLFVTVALSLGGCSTLPRDQDGWTEKIQSSRVLIVGTTENRGKPAETAIEKRERAIIERLAKRLNARIEWKGGNVHELLQDLEERKLPLVAASLPADSPFAANIGFTTPYCRKGPGDSNYCLAVAPGENRLLYTVDQIIAEQEKEGGSQ
jgi:hypothetical protein